MAIVPEVRIVAHIDRPRGWVVRGGSDRPNGVVATIHSEKKDAVADAVRQLRSSRTGGELTILSTDGRRQEVRMIEPSAVTNRVPTPSELIDLVHRVERPQGRGRGVVTTVLVFGSVVLVADVVAVRLLDLSGLAYVIYGVVGILLGGALGLWAGRRIAGRLPAFDGRTVGPAGHPVRVSSIGSPDRVGNGLRLVSTSSRAAHSHTHRHRPIRRP